MEMKKQRKQSPSNDRARKLVYKKRKECIKKKTMELSTLRDIKACAVIFGPDGNVDTWPENQSAVKAIIENYRDYNKKHKNTHKRARIEDGLKKNLPQKGSDEFIDGLSKESLIEFLRKIELKIEAVNRRFELLKMEQQNRGMGQETEQSSNYLFDMFSGDINQTVGEHYLFNPALSHYDNFNFHQTIDIVPSIYESNQYLFNGQFDINEFTFNQPIGDMSSIQQANQFSFNTTSVDAVEFTVEDEGDQYPYTTPFDVDEWVFPAEVPSLVYYSGQQINISNY